MQYNTEFYKLLRQAVYDDTLNEAKETIEEYNKNKFNTSMNNLVKQALQTRNNEKWTKGWYVNNRRKNNWRRRKIDDNS